MVLVAGKMYRPTGLAVDTDNDHVYVLEQFNHRITRWIYDPDAVDPANFDFTLDVTWGDKTPTDGTMGGPGPVAVGDTDNNFDHPSGIAFHPGGFLYVSDTLHNRMRTINVGTSTFSGTVGQGGSGNEDFYHPAGIALETDTNTRVVIADELNHRAVEYTTGASTLAFSKVLADPSTGGDKNFLRPHGVTYDVLVDTFNVTDSSRGLISSYNGITGAFVNQYGTPGTTGTDLFFPGSGEGNLIGTTATVFADTRNNKIKTMENEVIAVTTGTAAGRGLGQLYYPDATISFGDTAQYVLAVNTRNNRVEVYESTGTNLVGKANFGSP